MNGRKQRTVLNGETSEWDDVWSGVPQGSVLGPLAFLIYINDIDCLAENISIINKFADDTKLGHVIKDVHDVRILQDCLNALVEWANTWGMSFNVDKCKVMHVGLRNPCLEYKMNGKVLACTELERDIGVLVHKTLKPSKQCTEASRRANGVLGKICRSFHYRDRHTFVKLYIQYVRPHLEFAVPAWAPWSAGDKEVLEKVQRRAVKMISGLQGATYEDRLKELKLQTFEDGRKMFNLVQTLKILKGFDNVKTETWFIMVGENQARITRATTNPLNLVQHRSKSDIRKNFFSQRVVESWNNLPSELKESRSVQSFKSNLIKLMLGAS